MAIATPVRIAVIAKHVALALALAASTALLIDYQNAGDPAFCGVASGCFAVRVSAYSHVLGIPLPNLALPAFGILLGGSLLARTLDQHRLVAVAAGLGGLFAVALVLIQAFAVGAFCPWCMIVDSAAIVCGAASLALWQWLGDSEERAAAISARGPSRIAWGLAGALAVALPVGWSKYPVIPPAPPDIAAEQVPGKVTIVSFTDFECPFCRKLHPLLDQIREEHHDQLHFVRKMKPLASHVGAMPAAKAWVCVPENRRDKAAALLYAMPPTDFTEQKLVQLADKLHLGDRAAFESCMRSSATEAAIDRDSEAFARVGGRGLPLTWVGPRVIVGLNPDRIAAAVEDELNGPRPGIPLAALIAALGAVFAIAAAVSWLAPSPRPDEESPAGQGDAPLEGSP
jgi:uncharacterized membrane protein/thiol-disulfide isomerase/thioredoxin